MHLETFNSGNFLKAIIPIDIKLIHEDTRRNIFRAAIIPVAEA